MDGMNGNQIETVIEETMVGETVVVETVEDELSQSNSTAEPDSNINGHKNEKAQVANKEKVITPKPPKQGEIQFNPPVPASTIHVKASTPSTKLHRRQTTAVVAAGPSTAGPSTASPRSDAPSTTSHRCQLTAAAVPAGPSTASPRSDAPSTTLHRRQSNAAFGHSPSAETSFKRIASDTSATLPQRKKHKNNNNNNNNKNNTRNKNASKPGTTTTTTAPFVLNFCL